MTGPISETRFRVSGVHTSDDVRKASQALFDIFAASGIGQATFEITGNEPATLILKHGNAVTVDAGVIDQVLSAAGDYAVIG